LLTLASFHANENKYVLFYEHAKAMSMRMLQGGILKQVALAKSPHNRSLCALAIGLGISENAIDLFSDQKALAVKQWKAEFDRVYSNNKNNPSRFHSSFSSVGKHAVSLLYELYSTYSAADERSEFLAKTFERAAKRSAIENSCGFIVWNIPVVHSQQIAVCNDQGCKMMYAVYCAVKTIAEAFKQTWLDVKRASESEAIRTAVHQVATHLHNTLDPIVNIEAGGRSSGMFGAYAAVSGVPIMPNGRGSSVPSPNRKPDDTANVSEWIGTISSSYEELWKIASDVIDGKVVDATRLTSVRTRCIYVLQYFARMFTISLACTGHMRTEDWYNLYMSVVFGVDGNEDGTGFDKLAANHPQVEVPAAGGLRDIVWNLDLMPKAHRDAFAAKEACLTGILCIVTGTQQKKLSKVQKTNASDDEDPEISYNLNALIDGEWGVMSAGNAMVLARGLLELYNYLALHTSTAPIVYTSVVELQRAYKSKERAETEGSGGESYLAECVNKALKRTGCCSISTGMPVKKVAKIGGIVSNVGEHSVARTYSFKEELAIMKEIDKEGRIVGNKYIDRFACATHIRKELESSLGRKSVAASHVLKELGPQIGHGKRTQHKHYMKPPCRVKFTLPTEKGFEEITLNVKEQCKTKCSLLTKGHLKCGDFGINAGCPCSIKAVHYRHDNQKAWMQRISDRPEAPNMLEASTEHLARLVRQTKEAVDKLFRPTPRLFHRWATVTTEQIAGAECVKRFSDAMDMLANEVVRRIRKTLEMEYAEQSETRLKGVSCCAMMAAKMFGPWAFEFDLLDETNYDTYLAADTVINCKRHDYIRGLPDTAELQRSAKTQADAMFAEHRERLQVSHAEELCLREKEYEAIISEQQARLEAVKEELAKKRMECVRLNNVVNESTRNAQPTSKRAKNKRKLSKAVDRIAQSAETELPSPIVQPVQANVHASDLADEIPAPASSDADRDDTRRNERAPEDEDPTFTCNATVSPEAPSRPRCTRATASKRRCDAPLAQQVKRARQTKACTAPKEKRTKKHQQKNADDEQKCLACDKAGTQLNRLFRCKRVECGALYHQKCVPHTLTAEEEWLCPICIVPATPGKLLRATEEKEHFEEHEHSMPLSGSEPSELWPFVDEKKIDGNGMHLANVKAGNSNDGWKKWYAHMIIAVYRDGVKLKIFKQVQDEDIMNKRKYRSYDRRHMSMSEDATSL
jgi:hypothetical protein